jgi:RHS repeat-associated protein
VKTREYIWLPANDNSTVDLPLAVIDISGTTATVLYVHADHLGRPIRMTSPTKTTVWQATWKPWGEVQTLSGTNSNNLRYPGQYFQIETGLHYNHHRMYDPVTGRYTQADPLRFVDGPSVYAYAKNSPYMYTDREGQCPICAMIIGGAIGGMIGAIINNGSWQCTSWADLGKGALLGSGAGLLGGLAVAALLETGGVAALFGAGAEGSISATNLAARANQIHGALVPIAQNMRTTAVLQTNLGRIVAGGGVDLTAAQRAMLAANEVAAALPGAHAEITALEAASASGAVPRVLAATRAICPACAAAIEASGGKLINSTTAIWH